jgi:hypothetical protein
MKGWRARVAALFLLAPLPVIILSAQYVSRGLNQREAQTVFGLTELLLSLAGVGGAFVFAYLSRPKDDQTSRQEDV